MSKFSIAIVSVLLPLTSCCHSDQYHRGAGLSGLISALSLQKFAPDVEFAIYDAVSELSEIGAGIGLAPRAWAIIQAIGLEEALLKVAGDGGQPCIPHMHRKSDQVEGVIIDRTVRDEMNYSFFRAELQRVLLEHLFPKNKVRLNKRLVSYVQRSDGSAIVELLFEDGSTAQCDVLLGCDGIRSRIRANMYSQLADQAQAEGRHDEASRLRSHITPVFSGEIVYRCLIRKDTLPEGVSEHPAFNASDLIILAIDDPPQHIVTYPVSQGRVLNVGAGVSYPEQEGTIYEGSWTSAAGREEITKEFVGWEADVQELVQYVNGGLKWVINVVTKLPTYVHGRVALVGDAAHAMGHHLGAGAGQSFEDAFLLAKLISHPGVTKGNIPVVLGIYDEVRRPFTQHVAALARRRGKLHHLDSPELAWLTAERSAKGDALSQEQLGEISEMMERCRDWQFGPSVLEESVAAQRKLEGAFQPL
ncbi:FAD/NAD(P)-binding domain-containing protein [Dichomitus squalens LYAD-421 SS1]|uniref:FAD/NAD(P)-binding domain-containing protein n=1 Tax=Dichomitus squalens (strain LYAD-421) TaxID=732165 RepID=UPI0004410DBF|nr:FAD/NAD(P)-binding domain-containing protein [Dichomitus squalens LYAD-421 SS1]EJF63098.1 FAD/NAD(P)-binding domain-containing protein [Dichomitus squalens LYAD-421 SS1]